MSVPSSFTGVRHVASMHVDDRCAFTTEPRHLRQVAALIDNCTVPQPTDWISRHFASETFISACAASPVTIFPALQAIHDVTSNTSVGAQFAVVMSALNRAYSLEAQGRGRTAARELMLVIEVSLRKNSLLEVNCVLAHADISRLSSRSLIGLIRSTARVRKQLPAWKNTYKQSWSRISQQGKKPESLFMGLPHPSEDDFAGAAR